MNPIISTEPDNDNDNKQPWWVNPIYKFGVPSVLAIFLVWFLTVQVRDKLENIDNKLDNHINVFNPIIRQNDQMLVILRQICVNSATTNYERGQCLQ